MYIPTLFFVCKYVENITEGKYGSPYFRGPLSVFATLLPPLFGY
jgi:hypothetical protein